MSNKMWADDAVQFLCLLAEINAVGLKEEQWEGLVASMNLTSDELRELFDRAGTAWETIKANAAQGEPAWVAPPTDEETATWMIRRVIQPDLFLGYGGIWGSDAESLLYTEAEKAKVERPAGGEWVENARVFTAEEIGNQHGFRCPQCGHGDNLLTQAVRPVEVSLCSDGTDDKGGDTEWEADSDARCSWCDWSGFMGDLKTVKCSG